MRATLIYPPLGDPRAPQLALPSLAAVLRPAGIETDLVDLNVSGILALLRPDCIRKATRILERRGGERNYFLSRLAERAAELATHAVDTLHHRERFYDPHEYSMARDVIFTAVEASGAAAVHPAVLGLFPIRYEVPGVNAQLLRDLIQVTADDSANVFAEHWEAEVFPALDRAQPDFIGITITNRQQIIPGLMLARRLRSRGHFVVIGGTLYTKFVDQLRGRPDFFRTFADGVVVYEGETAILAIADELSHRRDFRRVPNYLHLDAGGAVRMGPVHVENVEELPTPDFSGLPLPDYLTPDPVLPILTGKGCYFNRCKFCDIPYINHVSRKNYRVRSPEKIVSDVQRLSARFRSRHFVITDEALAPKLLEDLAAILERHSGEHYSFTGYARLEHGFTADLCRRLGRIGMRKLFFGMESAAQETLDHMDKGTKADDAAGILENCRNAGIAFHVFSIIGFPEENEESAQRTFQFFLDHKSIVDHPANSFDIHPFGLELRTEYFRGRDACGVIVSDAALAQDFAVGIAGGDWINSRGLSKERVLDLIENDFYPQLRRMYRTYHNTRGQLWPGFEEYSMLYSDHYLERPFPFLTSIPDAGQPVWLRLNPAVMVDDDGELVRLTSRSATVSIPAGLYRLLCDEKVHTPEELADMDRLIEYGFVQVKVASKI